MTMTSGAILRRIIAARLSFSAHALATIILDGTSWKTGFNGLQRGTASFQLTDLMETMDISRQHLSTLLAELDASTIGLTRKKLEGKYAPWIFRWLPVDKGDGGSNDSASQDETSPLIESLNKTVFTGRIEIGDNSTPLTKAWKIIIDTAKRLLPCCSVAAEVIWERFQAFNRAKGNTTVPAGYLLGFMRKWRVVTPKAPAGLTNAAEKSVPAAAPQDLEALRLAAPAPASNWKFHQADLLRLIGVDHYERRILALMDRLGVNHFAAMLAVHGQAAASGELRL